ncbi:hypothetical protein [Zobellia nedashkovskayae]|uniref:hypothetical protein n=1 Tax=Zobellia nedashkovskayae TaxID=2779510 RepID=UPI00188CA6A8|nr:hypothetical protein [Zobellia nedashkovskayae]
MEKKKKAESQDDILKYMLSNSKVKTKHSEMTRMFGSNDFYKDLFNKEFELEIIDKLILEIIEFGNDIVKNPHKQNIEPNQNTQKFLNDGGFVSEYYRKTEEDNRKNEYVLGEQRIRELQEENLILNNKFTTQKLKTHWVPIIISMIGVAISIVALGASKFQFSDNFVLDGYIKRIEQLEYNQKQLEKDLLQENYKLKEEVYKAEMLISVCEEPLN